MARSDVLVKIKDAEARVADDIQKAKDHKAARAKEAVKEAARIKVEMEQAAIKDARKLVDEARARTLQEKQRIIQEGQKGIMEVRVKGEERLEPAIEKLVGEFERRVVSK